MLEKFIAPLILVMEDVHETRDGIEKLHRLRERMAVRDQIPVVVFLR